MAAGDRNRDTGRKDAKNRTIFIGPRGGVFVRSAAGGKTRPVVKKKKPAATSRPGPARLCRTLTTAQILKGWPKNPPGRDLNFYDVRDDVMENPAKYLGPGAVYVTRKLIRQLLKVHQQVVLSVVNDRWNPFDPRKKSGIETFRLRHPRSVEEALTIAAGGIHDELSDSLGQLDANGKRALLPKLVVTEERVTERVKGSVTGSVKWKPIGITDNVYPTRTPPAYDDDGAYFLFSSGESMYWTWAYCQGVRGGAER